MNIKSIRFRLTLWYVLAFIIFSGILFAGFFLLTKKALYVNTDSALSTHSQKTIEILSSTDNTMHEEIARQSFLQEFSGIPGMLVIVLNKSGNLISSSSSSKLPETIISRLFNKASETSKPYFSDETVGELPLRFLVTPVKVGNSLSGVVLMAHPIEIIQNTLRGLFITLGVIYLILVVPTIIGGYLLAKSSLKPLAEITEKLKRVGSENFEEKVRNPDTGDEIEDLAETFNSMLLRIREAFERERMLIGDLAHELKTPLATLRSGVEIALSKPRSKDDYKEALTETLVDVNNISGTLKNILDLAWTRSDSARGKLEKVNLSEMTKELVDITEKLSIGKKINVTATIGDNIKVLGNEDKIMRAFLNIVDNAVKFTPNEGSIYLSLRKKDSFGVLSVKDSGIGISKKDIPHIFDRFYRGERTQKIFGSGLGLAIAQALINAHQGLISVTSKPGYGTVVTIELPLVQKT